MSVRTWLAAGIGFMFAAQAGAAELNLYTARHYDTDTAIYAAFTRATGIQVRVIEGKADELIERIRTEGANSPADLFLTVDAARLSRAKEAGILQNVQNATLTERVPANYRDADGAWFGLTMRARVIMYDRQNGRPEGLNRYEDLADPRFNGQVCIRSSNSDYNISLAASILRADGESGADAWARGMVANMARPPQGGDRPQFEAIPSGQCRIAIANTYYLARYVNATDPQQRELGARIGVIFPNQADRGAHVNISGVGLTRHAPNRDAAIKFMEFLTSVEAQEMFTNGNFEYPVVAAARPNPALATFGTFKADALHAQEIATHSAQALQIMQRAGWR